MSKVNVVHAKSIREIAKEMAARMADDPKVLDSVRASMDDLAMHQTVSFEEAFELPRPR
jgi:hypothetical protein